MTLFNERAQSTEENKYKSALFYSILSGSTHKKEDEEKQTS